MYHKAGLFSTYNSVAFAEKAYRKYKHFFPIEYSPSLAYIFGCLITDGFIDIRKRHKSLYFGYAGYFSKNNYELKEFNNSISSNFKISGKIKSWGIRKYGFSQGCIITNSFFTRLMHIARCPHGDKVAVEYRIPDWISNGPGGVQKMFLKTSFDCEGSIHYSCNRNCWEIKYSMYKIADLETSLNTYLNQLKSMMAKFKIKTSGIQLKEKYTRKKDSKKVIGKCIRISNKESIINFYREIGFNNRFKMKRLRQAYKDNIYK